MKRITSIVAGVGVLVLGMTLPARAQDASTPAQPAQGTSFVDEDGDGICDFTGQVHQMRGRMGKNGTGQGLGAVTLTPEQQAQVDKLNLDHQKSVTATQAILQAKQVQLSELIRAATPDQNAINAKIDEINSMRSQLQKEAAAYQVAVRSLLTSDQKAALDASNAATGMGRRGMGAGHATGSGKNMTGQGNGMGSGHGMMGQGHSGTGATGDDSKAAPKSSSK